MLNKEFYKNASVKNLIDSKDMKDMNVRDFDQWLNSKHSILDDSERRYLRNIVLPFYDKVTYITKIKASFRDKYYIKIMLTDYDYIDFPYFREDEMYCGMKEDNDYTLKELGIFK